MELKERIRRWREGRSLTIPKLASLVGVTPEAVYQWESGDTRPSLRSIDAMALVFNVSIPRFWGEPPADKRAKKAKKRGAA